MSNIYHMTEEEYEFLMNWKEEEEEQPKGYFFILILLHYDKVLKWAPVCTSLLYHIEVGVGVYFTQMNH